MEAGLKILVCGGRTYGIVPLDPTEEDIERAKQEKADLYRALDRAHAKKPITLIINGGATGADMLSTQWAISRGIRVNIYPANWNKSPRGAGPIRNREMFNDSKPDGVIAFPGGTGTTDMIEVVTKAGMKPWRPYG